MTGVVRALRQPGPSDLDTAYAVKLPRQLSQIVAYIDLDRPLTGGSLVGRQCRVLLTARERSWARAMAERVAEALFRIWGG